MTNGEGVLATTTKEDNVLETFQEDSGVRNEDKENL